MASRELQVSVALGGLSAAVALALGGVFASAAWLGPLLGAALLPHALGWATRRWTRAGAWNALVAAAGLVVYAGALVGSPGSRLGHELSAGWHVMFRDRVPLPATEGAVLLAVVAVWAVASVADDLAFLREGTVSALAPATVVLVWVEAYDGRRSWVPATLLFGVSAGAFLALQHHLLSDRRRTVVGHSSQAARWRLVAVAVLGALAATLCGAAVAAALPRDQLVRVTGSLPGGVSSHYEASVSPDVFVGNQLQQGPNVEVFTVRASQPAYWRLVALDEFSGADGGEWTIQAHGNAAVGQGLSGPVPKDALRQTFHIGPLGDRWMPAAFEPVAVSRADTLVVRDSDTLVSGTSSVSGLSYTVQSRVPPASASTAEQAATSVPVPASLRRFIELPGGIPAIVRDTARDVTAGSSSPYAKAAALEQYFRSGLFTYDPNEVLGDSGDAIARFLEIRRGFCVQFASAYAVMAREVGIPSRMATGYTQGTPDASGTYHVTSHEAHAWPEIWLAGIGWTDQFDPTPNTGQPGASTVGEPTPAPAPAQQSPPVPSTAAPAPPATGAAGGTAPTSPRPSVSRSGAPSRGSAWAWAAALAGLALVLALVWLVSVPVRRARRRTRRRAAADPAEAVAGAWAEALDRVAATGVSWPPSLTPLEVPPAVPGRLGDALERPLGSLARRYTSVRYGARAPDRAGVDAAWREVDDVQRALDDSLGLRTRLRARLRRRDLAQPEPAGWSGWSRRRSSSTKV